MSLEKEKQEFVDLKNNSEDEDSSDHETPKPTRGRVPNLEGIMIETAKYGFPENDDKDTGLTPASMAREGVKYGFP